MLIKRLIFICGILLSWPVFAIPTIQHWQTVQGVDVYFVESHELPMVDIQVIFDAGSSRDAEVYGLALLTNSLLTEGAAGLDADIISARFEEQGAQFSADAGYDSASLSLRSLSRSQNLMPAVENLVKVISAPDFPESAIERQRNRMLVGIKYKQQSPASLARDAFYKELYADHPYAHPKEGTEQTLAQISKKDIKAFYQRYYVAANAMLVMVGDLERNQAETLANDLMQNLDKGEPAKPLAEVTSLAHANTIEIHHPSTQTHILLGQPGVKRGDPDYFPLYVGNHVLGGGGMVSRLFEEVRETRGLSYSVQSYFNPMKEAGPFIAGLQTQTGQADEARAVLMTELEKFIQHGPTETELDASKKNITGSFPLKLNSNSKIAAYVAMIGFYGLPLDYLHTFNEKVENVTVEQIKLAFKEKLDPKRMITVMVGNKNTTDGENY